uniref:Protein kinase domain-containing protein n=1 Tax=Meloidogyne enterolobii TaxID=390850 RepID=A0A6V7U1F8_MELEN|nr:unnamed protein product [Meloidogyne enterolobii]
MVILYNDQQQKRRSKKIRWACIHPFPITEEQEERKHKLWAKTMIELTNKMNEVWIPPINNNRIDQNGESTSCELQNNEKYNQNDILEEENVDEDDLPELSEVPSNNTFVPVQDEHGYLLCRNGDWIIDRFKIIKQIGDGVFSKVHLVSDSKNLQRSANGENPSKRALKIVRNVQAYKDAALQEISVLQALHSFDDEEENGLGPSHLVIKLLDNFEYFDHICLLFEPYGLSVFDFLRGNDYHPYPLDQIRYIAYQLILAVNFIHEKGIVHTDLKPENILFVNTDNYEFKNRWDKPYEEMGLVKSKRSRNRRRIRVLKDASIRLIDFGSAVFEHQGHDETVTTRHYRAPEIILKNGWSFPCDIWSIGCILFELYSGCALFPKMDDIKHLATIERICGAVPKSMKRASSCGFYRNNNQLNCSQEVKEHVKEHTRKLFDYIKLKEMEHIQFFDLLENMLVIDPDLRITLKVAREHDFFEKLDNNLRLKAENGENINENGAT